MKYLKGKIASLVLGTPIAFLSACYGPEPFYYSCQNDHHCRQFPDGKCEIQDGKDSAGEKGGYCEYPGYKRCYSDWVENTITYVPENEECPDRNWNNSSDSSSDGASDAKSDA